MGWGGRRRLFTASANNVTAVGARKARASLALAHKSSGVAPGPLPEAPPGSAGPGGIPGDGDGDGGARQGSRAVMLMAMLMLMAVAGLPAVLPSRPAPSPRRRPGSSSVPPPPPGPSFRLRSIYKRGEERRPRRWEIPPGGSSARGFGELSLRGWAGPGHGAGAARASPPLTRVGRAVIARDGVYDQPLINLDVQRSLEWVFSGKILVHKFPEWLFCAQSFCM